jgi:hypothetical protein
MREYNMSRFIVSIVILIVAFSANAQESQPINTKDFLAEYAAKVEKIRSKYDRLNCVVNRYRFGSNLEMKTVLEGKFSPEYFSLQAISSHVHNLKTKEKTESSPPAGTEIRNPHYEFIVQKTEEGYRLRSLKLASKDTRPTACFLVFPFGMPGWGESYLEVLRRPSTRILSAEKTTWNNRGVFRVTVEVEHAVSEKKEKHCHIWLFSIQENLACAGIQLGSSVDGKRKPSYEFEYTYTMENGWPQAVLSEEWLLDPQTGKRKTLQLRQEIELTPATNWDESQFYLSHYGLPEPVGIKPPSRTPLWVWLAVVAVALLALYVAFRLLASRTATSPPVKNTSDG